MGLLRKLIGEPGPEHVRVHVARHQPEVDFIISLLRAADIPCRAQRTRGFDVPDLLAAGPRDILVPEPYAAEARQVIQPVLDGDWSIDEDELPS